MLQKIKMSIIAASALLTMGTLAVAPAMVSAQADIQGSLCNGSTLTVDNSGGGCASTSDAPSNVNTFITNAINVFSIIVGLVAVVMIIVAGLRYVTSGGDSTRVTGAKNAILYAVIGLVIVALAQFIVRFVLNKATNAGS